MSVRLSASNNSAATARIFMKFYISLFSENCRENTSFITISQEWRVLYMKTTRHFWSYLAKFLLKWEMFQTKVVEENKTHLLWSVNFFFKENGAVYEIMWINIAEPDRPQMTIWRTRITCWIPNSTVTHSECVILIPSPLQLSHFRHGFWTPRNISSSTTYLLSSHLLKAVVVSVADLMRNVS